MSPPQSCVCWFHELICPWLALIITYTFSCVFHINSGGKKKLMFNQFSTIDLVFHHVILLICSSLLLPHADPVKCPAN